MDRKGPVNRLMELGVYSFGDAQHDADGTLHESAEAIRNLFDAIVAADRVGLDYFGVGEHHTAEMPASSPGALIAAAAGATEQIRLGSSVSVLSTDDPVRVFQQFATADAISGGRVEITAGRGSSQESFPLFGHSLSDYDQLYTEKLDLLLKVNANERVTWSGAFRPSLRDALVVPRPVNGSLPIWLATGGSPPSSARAGALGLPIAYAIIGGYPERFAPLANLYRESALRAGHTGDNIKVSVATLGFVGETTEEARETWYPHWFAAMDLLADIRGGPRPNRDSYEYQVAAPGAFFVGDAQDVADRIVALHRKMGHARQFLQMDLGGLPQPSFLKSIELLGAEVAPRVAKALDD